MNNFGRITIATVGLAVLGIGISSQVGSNAKLTAINTNSPGLLSGNGQSTNPLSMSVSADGTSITGNATSGTPLDLTTALSTFAGTLAFGDGSDGACTWDGTTVVLGDTPTAPVANETLPVGTTKVYDLSGWRFCSSASVAAGVAVHGIYPIFVNGNLQLDGAITNNGCHSSTNGTGCSASEGGGTGFLSRGTSGESTATGVSCFIKPYEMSHASVATCAVAAVAGGAGNNGTDGNAPTVPGCGGGGGTRCNDTTAGRAAPKSALSLSDYGLGDMQVADGYISFLNGLSGSACAGTSGGSDCAVVSTFAPGGGGAGWVVVHAKTITGGGSIEARGGIGRTNTASSVGSCPGGGGGGGGGVADVVIDTGSFPTINVSGGLGGHGVTCTCCSPQPSCGACPACAGLHGGEGANGSAGVAKTWKLRP